ncbi:MAG: GNAT family N-acetyltransferase [Paracoccaceae bacterium]
MIQLDAATLAPSLRFLEARIETSIFALSNVARHGIAGGHPRAMTLWADDPARPGAVLGLSDEGMVLPQLPGGVGSALPVLRERALMGIVGETAQVEALRKGLSLDDAPTELDAQEVRFTLDLADLIVPEGAGELVPLADVDLDAVGAFRAAAGVETMGWSPATAPARGRAEVARFAQAGTHAALVEDGRPTALTGFNATHGETVQVGAVYVPPALRGAGRARRAVGLHLAQARAGGAARALLFTGSPMAERAYRALGFAPAGSFTLLVFAGAVTPEGPGADEPGVRRASA